MSAIPNAGPGCKFPFLHPGCPQSNSLPRKLYHDCFDWGPAAKFGNGKRTPGSCTTQASTQVAVKVRVVLYGPFGHWTLPLLSV